MINYDKKPITKYQKGETIHITRREGNYTEHYYCKFLALEGQTNSKEKGLNIIVKGEILECSEMKMLGVVIKARVDNCYLLDGGYEEHWFDEKGNIK